MDPTQFRERFKAWKDGKKPYKDGLPTYSGGKTIGKFTKQQEQTLSSIYNTFKTLGYDDNSIFGILGNALTESSLNGDSISQSKLYHGLLQNSVPIKKAIVNKYGDYSLKNQMKYVHDWVSGADWVKKNADTTTYNGKYKMSGYKTASEAADAFTRLYERPVILDNTGNVTGYRKADERMANAELIAQYFANKNGIKTTTLPDGNKRITISPSVYQVPEYKSTWQPAQPINTDYPLSGSQAPESLSSWNATQSPSATPTIPSIQKLNNERQKAVQGAFQLPEVTVLGNRRTSLLPKMPSLNDALMAYSPQNQMNRAMSQMMGLDDLWEDFDVTSDLFKAKNGKLPKYKWGFGPINIWGSLKGAAKMLRDRMYRTVTPSGYTTEQVKNFITGKRRQGYQDPNTEAVYGMYTKQDSIDTQRYGDFLKRNNVPHRVVGEDAYGEPIQRVAVKDLIVPSTVEQGAYEFKYPNLPGQYPLVPKGTVGESKWLHSHTLGGYEKGTSADNNGTYDYYKDRWDINPFKGVSSTQDESPLFKAGNAIGLGYFDDIVPWGNPVNIHGKVYQKDNNPDTRPTEEKWKLFGSYKNGKTPKLKYRQ